MLRTFSIKQGDQLSFTVTFKNLQTSVTTFEIGVKEDYGTKMLIHKSLGNGITKIGTATYRVDFLPSETKELEPFYYVYDIRITLGTSVFTPLYGYLIIEETVFE